MKASKSFSISGILLIITSKDIPKTAAAIALGSPFPTAEAMAKVIKSVLFSAVTKPESGNPSSYTANVADISNKGFEITLTSTPVNKDFKWDINANFSRNINKIELVGIKEKTYTETLLLTTTHIIRKLYKIYYPDIPLVPYPEMDLHTRLLVNLPESERQKMIGQINNNEENAGSTSSWKSAPGVVFCL